MKRRDLGIAAATTFALAVLVIIPLILNTNRPVLTPGPCVMLGIGEVATHPGVPLLVIDCEGFQFGVRAVMP